MRLSEKRYEEIKKEIANFYEDYNIKKLPINVFEIAKKMKIDIIFASYYRKKRHKKVSEYALFSLPESMLCYNKKDQKFIVYIDDICTKKKRQRFSLAHELMHIILGHNEQNSKNELEANFGATYLLAPTSLALLDADYGYLLCPEIVADIFNVSLSEAFIITKYNDNRVNLFSLNERDYEKIINSLLKDSINDKLSRYY